MSAILVDWINSFISKTLQMDNEVLKNLEKHSGKIISIIVDDLDISLKFIINKNNIKLISEGQVTPNAIIQGSLIDLAKAGCGVHFSKLKLAFEGDMELIENINLLINKFDPKFSLLLASYIGDEPAIIFSDAITKGRSNILRQLKDRKSDLIEFAQEELKITPTREQINYIKNEIIDFEIALDRLEAKINILENNFYKTSDT